MTTTVNFDNPLGLQEAVIAKMRAHAISVWPNECCGIIVDGEYIAQQNKSPKPSESFLISNDVWEQYGEVQAVVHSHCAPKFGIEPTETDMTIQRETAMPWAIMLTRHDWASKPLWFGDYRLDQPLVGREFMHGVLDCYSLIRAWYWQKKGVKLMDFPRNNNWWQGGEVDLYRDNFEKCGFTSVDPEDLTEGDIVLFCLRGDKTHHAGIYLESGLILHHLCTGPGRKTSLSCTDSYSRWKKFATHHVRRVA
jgi:proteasome lid subunit RPN8/RPN11